MLLPCTCVLVRVERGGGLASPLCVMGGACSSLKTTLLFIMCLSTRRGGMNGFVGNALIDQCARSELHTGPMLLHYLVAP